MQFESSGFILLILKGYIVDISNLGWRCQTNSPISDIALQIDPVKVKSFGTSFNLSVSSDTHDEVLAVGRVWSKVERPVRIAGIVDLLFRKRAVDVMCKVTAEFDWVKEQTLGTTVLPEFSRNTQEELLAVEGVASHVGPSRITVVVQVLVRHLKIVFWNLRTPTTDG